MKGNAFVLNVYKCMVRLYTFQQQNIKKIYILKFGIKSKQKKNHNFSLI